MDSESLESATCSDKEMIALSKQIENNSSQKEDVPAKPKIYLALKAV